ncbi:hypothetical protein JYU29_17695 [Tianweitania sp. BSSL-BM11]|uniref:Lipoprotein n=1 Tax=Tianweitania aestuarii TaxID=2814886 RepID=A0ABS5S3M5_9HYPH|nr:hypothetical protein [Tianweitania aestuarii]MBS9722532.1 hypothetical protein [Tianweitania aestuarii]
MEHIAAVLLLIGCSDDMSACRELPVQTAIFETAQECEAEINPAIAGMTTTYTQLIGKCVPVDPAMEEEDAELVWNLQADGTLYAAVEVPDVMVAQNAAAKQDRYVAQE